MVIIKTKKKKNSYLMKFSFSIVVKITSITNIINKYYL